MGAYRVQISSDVDYERLIAEIYFDEKFVALVSQEEGAYEVEFPGPTKNEEAITRSIPLETLQAALIEAKAKLSGNK